jgi:D-inositol-3-phosphate glycosyltransferase
MRISLVGPVTPYRGGIAHFTTLLAGKLIESGHDVQVVSFKKQYPGWLYPGESDKDYSPGREKVEAEYLLAPLNPFTWGKTVKQIAAFHPDEVVMDWWVTFWGPAFHNVSRGLNRRGFRTAFLIHNTMPHEARAFDRFLARSTLATASRFIVMTEKEKGRLLSLLPEAEEIDIAPLPIYSAFKKPALAAPILKRQLGLPKNQPILLFFGFVRPYKGLDVLIKAVKVLVGEGKPVHLLVAGEFWDGKKETEALIASLELEEYTHIHDKYTPDDEVAVFFEVSDLFVAPYVDCTQSAALKSALGFGLPAVLTDVIVDRMAAALPDRCRIVPAGDPAALAAGIREQLDKPRLNAVQTEELTQSSWQEMVEAVVKNKLPKEPMKAQQP